MVNKPNKPAPPDPEDKFSFFGNIDRDGRRPDGRIRNPLPAWYFDRHIKELRESVEQKERQIKMGVIGSDSIMMLKEEIRKQREIMVGIESSRLKLSASKKNKLWELYKHLSDKISDEYPTRTDMMKGLVNPHEELAKMKEPCIDISMFKGLIKAMNLNVGRYGKISRDEAVLAWKIAGKYLGEATNAETLRKDHKHGTFKYEKSLEEMETDYNPVSPLTANV